MGKSLTLLIPRQYGKKFVSAFSRVLKMGAEVGLRDFQEVSCLRRDGLEVTVEMSIARWRSREGLRFTGIIRDVTDRKETFHRLGKLLEEVVHAFSVAVEVRDPYTARHQVHMAALSQAIAQELGLIRTRSAASTSVVYYTMWESSPFPRKSSQSPPPLPLRNARWWINTPSSATRSSKGCIFPGPWLGWRCNITRGWTAQGTPEGCGGDEIILKARILAVADVVEATFHHRPYRSALELDTALGEIADNRGILYDPQAVDACLRLFRERGVRFDAASAH